MKNLLFILTFLPFTTVFSQEIKLIDGDYKLSEVVEVKATKDEIYKKIKTYLNQAANKSKYIIDTDDPNIGIISYNERTPEYRVSEFEINQASYKITTEIKDNKFRYTMSNINIEQNLWGLKLNKEYSRYSDFAIEKTTIDEIEKTLLTEKNERKKVRLVSDKEKNMQIISAKQKVLDDLVLFQKSNIESIKSFIERKDDW